MRELQSRKHMQRLRDKHGVMLTEPRKIVKALVDHWNVVSEKYGKSKEECTQFLPKPGICPELAQYGGALFKPLSLDIVTEGLRRLKTGGHRELMVSRRKSLRPFPTSWSRECSHASRPSSLREHFLLTRQRA